MNLRPSTIADQDAPALLFGEDAASQGVVTWRELDARVERFAALLDRRGEKRLGAILCRNVPEVIVAYLAAAGLNHAVMLLDPRTEPAFLAAILERYRPDWIYQPEDTQAPPSWSPRRAAGGYRLLDRAPEGDLPPLDPVLAILLSTSGSTGSPKMVRLSRANIESNAAAIAQYLGIVPGVRAITTLPLSYSFGMSVVNSHLIAGATLALTESGVLARDFWNAFRLHGVTSLPGVPYTYEILHRLDPRKLPLATLATLTQAGGRLAPRLVERFHEFAVERGVRLFVMYGQTEAAPRISYVPPEMLARKVGSIGVAIPGGRLTLSPERELTYEGPNVMLGYAERREDLARGDEMHGRLPTGDLASVDGDGFFFLTGRLKRMVKIHGNRMNLDEVEQHLESVLRQPVAVTGEDDRLAVYVAAPAAAQEARVALGAAFHLHATAYAVRVLEAIPRLPSGKKDYAALT